MSLKHPLTARLVIPGVLVACLAMIAVEALHNPFFFNQPGAVAFVLEPVGMILLYGLIVIWLTVNTDSHRAVLRAGTSLGFFAALIQMAHLAQEETWDLGKIGNGVSFFLLLFCTFLLWGAAGYRLARRTGEAGFGAAAGAWSAIVTMSLLVLFGLSWEFFLAPPKPQAVATWGEFQRSGWTDVHAFAIANTLDSAFSHLLAGPFLGAFCGAFAGFLASILRKPQPAEERSPGGKHVS